MSSHIRQKDITAILHKYRTIYGYSQEEVAQKIGKARSTYTNYELGNEYPSKEALERLAALYNVPFQVICGEEEEKSLDVTGLSVKKIYILKEIITSFIRDE